MTGSKLRFGVVNEDFIDGPSWFDHVRKIEQSGVDILLVRDHIVTEPFGAQLAPITMLSAAAACTTQLRIGTMVLDNDYRHPALLAHDAATIDWLSGGRFELGMGAGWLASEYRQIGMPFEEARIRLSRLDESVSIITSLLAGQTVTFHGKYYNIESLRLPISPVQRPRPRLLIGAGGSKMLVLAAHHADTIGILRAPIRSASEPDDPANWSARSLDVKLGIIRSAARERFHSLELSTFAIFEVTNSRRSATEMLISRKGWDGITCEEVWAMPSVFIGSTDQIYEDLLMRRDRFGITYFVTTDRNLDDLSLVLKRALPG
jgi:probable F420-dependent oxidoreductase